MTSLPTPDPSPRPKPSAGVRLARIAYAAIPIAVAAVILLGSFI